MKLIYKNKEITNPFMQAMALFITGVGLILAIIGLSLLPFLLLIGFLFEIPLKLLGRKGVNRGNGKYIFNKTSFEKI